VKVFPRNTLRMLSEKSEHLFQVYQNWVVTIAGYGTDIVEKLFWSDLATIPRLLWWWYAPIEFRDEGVLHDWLYKEQKWNGKKITRKQADQILYDYVEQTHGKTTARNFYYGVRCGGRKPWNKYKNDRIKNKEGK